MFCICIRVEQNHREDGTKAACLVEEACLHSIGRGWGAVPASREGVGIRGDREGILTPGMLTPDSVRIVSSADRRTEGYLIFILDVMRAVPRNIKYQFPENCLTAVRDVWGKRVCFACMFTSHGGFSELEYPCLEL